MAAVEEDQGHSGAAGGDHAGDELTLEGDALLDVGLAGVEATGEGGFVDLRGAVGVVVEALGGATGLDHHDGDVVADAAPGNWVDAWAPARWRPYLRLARVDRPIGAWLLFWPCAWSLALANLAEGRAFPNLWHLALFLIGSLVMRSAGCVWNDIVDRDFDARVARTRSRPMPGS